MKLFRGDLPCLYRQCQHSRQSGRRHFVIAESPEQARELLMLELAKARSRRCGDCRRPLALKNMAVIEEPPE